jgi:hypothetical protein
MRIYRLEPKTNLKRPAVRNKDGLLVLGSPLFGNQKHKTENKIMTASEEEAITLIRKGYSIRVETKSAPSLVRKNLFIDGTKVD